MKQTIVILVGSDRCGKTNIAKELSHRLQIPVFKASSEHHAFLEEPDRFIKDIRYADSRLVDFIKQTGVSVILDRGFPCEAVYSRVFNRETDRAAIHRIDDAYKTLGARVIICHRVNGYKGIVDDIAPEKLNSDMLEVIDREYRDYAHNYLLCKHMFLPVDDENLDREVTDIIKFLND